MQIIIQFNSLNNDSTYRRYFVNLKDNTYVFVIRWIGDDIAGFAELDISDYDDNPIITGRALVNNLKIRNHKLPYTLYFVQLDGETYEPTLDNISKEFALVYDDEEVLQ